MLASISYAGGIPMGLFHLPDGDFAEPANHRGDGGIVSPSYLMGDLSAIKSRGGKVVLNLAGSQKYYKDSYGHLSFTKWKARVDRFRNLNISPYISDGTIVGHYLIDEPYYKANFAGQAVPGSTLEAMAKYSKQIWPNMDHVSSGPTVPDQVERDVPLSGRSVGAVPVPQGQRQYLPVEERPLCPEHGPAAHRRAQHSRRRSQQRNHDARPGAELGHHAARQQLSLRVPQLEARLYIPHHHEHE